MSFTPKMTGRTNFQRFTDGPIYYFRFIGIDFKDKQSFFSRMLTITASSMIFFILIHQVIFIICEESNTERSAAIGLANYYIVGLGKILSMAYNRCSLKKNYENLKNEFPQQCIEKQYLKIFTRVQFILANFFAYLIALYVFTSLGQSLWELWLYKKYSFQMPIIAWYPVSFDNHIGIYIIYFCLESTASFFIGISIISADLCLFSSVSQLCLHFDGIAADILNLKPEEQQSIQQLKNISYQHLKIIKLSSEVNKIFTPSIMLSLLSSSFIICFTAFQLLDDFPYLYIIQTILLIMYECKQVIITCYYGHKLMDSSSNIFTATYMHNWYLAPTTEYKKLVLFILTNAKKPVNLNVAGTAAVSLTTLKKVFSFSYQMFAVLKTSQT